MSRSPQSSSVVNKLSALEEGGSVAKTVIQEPSEDTMASTCITVKSSFSLCSETFSATGEVPPAEATASAITDEASVKPARSNS